MSAAQEMRLRMEQYRVPSGGFDMEYGDAAFLDPRLIEAVVVQVEQATTPEAVHRAYAEQIRHRLPVNAAEARTCTGCDWTAAPGMLTTDVIVEFQHHVIEMIIESALAMPS